MRQGDGSRGPGPTAAGAEIDTTVPQSARAYDYLLGGKDNYAPDRATGAALIENVPALPRMVRAAGVPRASRRVCGRRAEGVDVNSVYGWAAVARKP